MLGDRWSLLVIRDMIFGNRRTFGELLEGSEEGIASNILTARLKRLQAAGLVKWLPDFTDARKGYYRLTDAAIELVPVLAQLGAWGARNANASPALTVRAEILERGGRPLWEAFMKELRQSHVRRPRFVSFRRIEPQTPGPVAQQLQEACEKALAQRR